MKPIFPKKMFYFILLFGAIYSTLNLVRNSILKYINFDFQSSSWSSFLFDEIIIENIYNLLLFLYVAFLTKYIFFRFNRWTSRFIAHIFSSVLTLIIIFLIYDQYLYYFRGITSQRFFNYYLVNILKFSNVHFLLYFSIVFIVSIYYYIERIKNVEIQKSELRQQLTQTQLNILKYQLHPHFFFNTLNTISSLIEIDKRLAQNTLADFSDLLRDIVYLKDTNFLRLYKELEILKRYLDIMKIRFSDHLKVNLQVDENLHHVLIPSFIIQPIIENSFKYGYSYENTTLIIEISIRRERGMLEIIVKNNGDSLSRNFAYGTGLKNTIARLKGAFGESYQFTIQNRKKNKGVITKIVIPLRE